MITFFICLLIVYFLGSVDWGLKKFLYSLFMIILLPLGLEIFILGVFFMKTEKFEKALKQCKD